ncbi:MAG: alpha-amylase family glycosyl hydrolase [Armatimonadetes bacterium]|nr:alpha-amylase family glycosyl hydrolase [Armatimonadota bacterium]
MPNLPDGTGLIALDAWLEPFAPALKARYQHYLNRKAMLEEHGGLLGQISQGHHYFGLNRGEGYGTQGVWYREWAPEANYLALIGDFNSWDRGANPLTRDEWGVWSLFLPDSEYKNRLTHGSHIKVDVYGNNGAHDRIPAYCRRVVQEADTTHFVGQYWHPPAFHWNSPIPQLQGGFRIYEAHIGMAQEEGKVGSFAEFTANILPRIAELGYNAIQLMAVMEHPYYGSFGYHVSNFFAVSSRFGTPEELKSLIDTAHKLGIRVIMDIVHSHSVKNLNEGLNHFDGTDHQYFHAPPRGEHPAWDSLCFDYAKYEVLRLLLSNVRYWLEEFHFDGFRFDGVTSMLYLDHGLNRVFTSYADYISENTDTDSLAYLMLANDLAHLVAPHAITIAEDVSGMPGMARPTPEGGVGFDYRLAMGVPDFWIKTIKELADEEWDLSDIFHTLLNRRAHEKHIGYVESHDQALVGDKTLAFQLMDREMYENMGLFHPSPLVDRGVALHKMIRLLTFSLAGEGYLSFMGNEFGHPDWIDFPREGNGFSYQYARRQWSLVDNSALRYAGLNRFDKAMLALDREYNLLEDPFIEQLAIWSNEKALVYRRGSLVFAFNFHPDNSINGWRIPVPDSADYRVILETDASLFSGHGRVEEGVTYPLQEESTFNRQQSVQIYLPSRTAQVLAPIKS